MPSLLVRSKHLIPGREGCASARVAQELAGRQA
jgi:hypothetical protein